METSKSYFNELPIAAAQGLGVLGAFALGALCMYMLDPTRGNARQARVRDQVLSKTKDASEFLGSKSRHISNVVRGTIAEAGSRVGIKSRSGNAAK